MDTGDGEVPRLTSGLQLLYNGSGVDLVKLYPLGIVHVLCLSEVRIGYACVLVTCVVFPPPPTILSSSI